MRPVQIIIRSEGAEHGQIRITVEDNAGGVPHENLDDLFEPFHTTKPAGTGLGLAICRRIVSEHGGVIEAHRNERQGLSVSFTLPRVSA